MAKLIYDEFRVQTKFALNSEDCKNIILYYMPLMGIDSYAVYSALMALDVNEVYPFKKLLNLLNFNNIDKINKAIDKLEGLGLIQTYVHKEKGYLFVVAPPLSKHQFFANEMLVGLLETQIGETEIKKLMNSTNMNIANYKNQTKRFDQVFQTSARAVDAIIDDMIEPQLVVQNQSFNYTLFKLLIDTDFIDEAVLDDSEFRSRIERISFTYKLNEEDMRDAIIRTIDIDQNFAYASIAKNAKIIFQNKYKAKSPRIETIQNDDYLLSVQDDKDLILLNMIENMMPVDILESLSKIKPSAAEIKMFDDLINNTKFPVSVINFMILLTCKNLNGEIPGYNYFEKIANTWARANVKNAYDALKYTRERKTKQTKTTQYSKTKKEKPIPSWYPEYLEQLKSGNKTTPMTKEEEQEMIELVKDMFN